MTICLAPRGTCVEGVFRSRSTCRVFGRASILASPSLERLHFPRKHRTCGDWQGVASADFSAPQVSGPAGPGEDRRGNRPPAGPFACDRRGTLIALRVRKSNFHSPTGRAQAEIISGHASQMAKISSAGVCSPMGFLGKCSWKISRMTKMPPAGYPAFLQYLQSGSVASGSDRFRSFSTKTSVASVLDRFRVFPKNF